MHTIVQCTMYNVCMVNVVCYLEEIDLAADLAIVHILAAMWVEISNCQSISIYKLIYTYRCIYKDLNINLLILYEYKLCFSLLIEIKDLFKTDTWDFIYFH